MPDVNTTGTKDKSTAGFEFLAGGRTRNQTLLFAGTTLPTTLTVGYVDDAGNSQVFQDGTITALPASITIENCNKDLEIVVTGGSPDFNVTNGGASYAS